MSLTLSRAGFDGAYQVTDRLLSNRNGSPFDPTSNKNVIFRASDAIVAVAYTGVAYIGKVPTDQWIASVLTNDLSVADASGSMVRLGTAVSQWPDLGTAVRRLHERLESDQYQEGFLELTITGWYRPGRCKRSRTILWSLTRETGSSMVRLERVARNALVPLPLFDGKPGSIGRWSRGDVERLSKVRIGKAQVVRPVVYTPWILGPGLISAPSALSVSGVTTIAMAGLPVYIIGPDHDGKPGVLMTAGRQRRPKRP